MTRRLCATACLVAIVVALPLAQRSPSPIRGRIVATEDGRALPRARVAVLADGRNLESVFADDRGTFNVVPGSDAKLVLSVTKAGYAVQHVTVPVSPSELIVKLPRGVSISGRVADPNGEGAVDVRIVARRQEIAAGEASDPIQLRAGDEIDSSDFSRPVNESVSIDARSADFDRAPAIGGGTYAGSTSPDGSCSMSGLHGPTRFQLMGRQDTWYLKSITIGGLDVTDTAFDFGNGTQTVTGAEVVISNAGAAISGHVTDASASPVSNYSVVVFPTDRTKWFVTSRFLRLARPTQDGSFEVTGLPPGEYYVAATDPIEGNDVSGDWLKSETLDQLSFRATRVTLTERQRLMTVLRLIRR